ncbi:MAG: hypothetical protein J1G01_00570 [Clostridiales bacterium]|nr:hypothetical protein [Clostridiales bacterium]
MRRGAPRFLDRLGMMGCGIITLPIISTEASRAKRSGEIRANRRIKV